MQNTITATEQAPVAVIPTGWAFQNDEEKREAAEWLENDAVYLAKCAAEYSKKDGAWYARMAAVVSKNSAHSASLAAAVRKLIK